MVFPRCDTYVKYLSVRRALQQSSLRQLSVSRKQTRNLRGRVQSEESCPETCGKVGRRLRYTALRSRHLSGVAAQEVVHRLLNIIRHPTNTLVCQNNGS